ncbi:MAG: tRNA (adenosine(37)-N6)-threonylcarbamoyltransferase complex ATPase subunit type 1 TsaE [Patescibacteria group bacterium]|nr:MAG: tRNA (adenosine(37)-N6)-threonylcarbamoyltransferase complex ATPase subunit type 1 TsaE [Patescibacteria group bacterium]
MKKYVTRTSKETAVIAKELAAGLHGGETIALYGDLGAGKTTFAQALAKALGVKKRVQSPTFILMQEYRLPKRGGAKVLLHVDAYRGDVAQFKAVGLAEYLRHPDTIVLVEWADRIQELLPKKLIKVRLAHRGGDTRSITIAG